MSQRSKELSKSAGGVVSLNRETSRVLFHSRRLWEWLEFSSMYLALIAVVEVLVVQSLLSVPGGPAAVVVGLITFAIYANDRLVDVESDMMSNPRRTAFVLRHRRALYVLAVLAYGVAVGISSLGGPLAFAIALLPGVTWTLYALDWVPSMSAPFQRLKEILVVNSLLVAAAWSLTVVFLPVAFVNAPIDAGVLAVLLYFVLGTFANTEISNARDIEADMEAGVSTLPVVFGVARTRRYLYAVPLLMECVVVYAFAGGHLSTVAAVALSVGALSLGGVTAFLGRIESDNLLPIAAECTRIPVFALLVVQSAML